MTSPELIEQVRELRQRGRTAKEIARALGLSPAAVAPLIRTVAAAQPKREAPLAGCWVNQATTTTSARSRVTRVRREARSWTVMAEASAGMGSKSSGRLPLLCQDCGQR